MDAKVHAAFLRDDRTSHSMMLALTEAVIGRSSLWRLYRWQARGAKVQKPGDAAPTELRGGAMGSAAF
jgi:hypothetical protein